MSNKSNSTRTREVIDRAGLAVETASMDGGMTEVDLERATFSTRTRTARLRYTLEDFLRGKRPAFRASRLAR